MSEDKARERFMYNSGHDFGMFIRTNFRKIYK